MNAIYPDCQHNRLAKADANREISQVLHCPMCGNMECIDADEPRRKLAEWSEYTDPKDGKNKFKFVVAAADLSQAALDSHMAEELACHFLYRCECGHFVTNWFEYTHDDDEREETE